MFSGKTGRGVGKWDLAEKGAKLGCNTRSHPTDGNPAQSLRELWAQHRSHFKAVLTKNQEAGVFIHHAHLSLAKGLEQSGSHGEGHASCKGVRRAAIEVLNHRLDHASKHSFN